MGWDDKIVFWEVWALAFPVAPSRDARIFSSIASYINRAPLVAKSFLFFSPHSVIVYRVRFCAFEKCFFLWIALWEVTGITYRVKGSVLPCTHAGASVAFPGRTLQSACQIQCKQSLNGSADRLGFLLKYCTVPCQEAGSLQSAFLSFFLQPFL